LKQRYVDGSAKYNEMKALVQDVSPIIDFTQRPYHEGGENHGAASAASQAWDLANGLVPSASGQLTVNDPDQASGHTWNHGEFDGTYGKFTLDASGKWTYVLDNTRPATQALAQGEPASDSFTAIVT